MKNEKLHNPRKRRMLLVFPLLVIPFLTLSFWAMGGGESDGANAQKQTTGLNLQLPNAQLQDDRNENKLSYYEQAEKDSLEWRQSRGNDPFFQNSLGGLPQENQPGYNDYSFQGGSDPNEQKVYQRLADLNSRLQTSEDYTNYNQSQDLPRPVNTTSSFPSEDITRLEELMNNASSPSTKDPEVEQLNTMMERILDIQHPERVKQKLSETTLNGSEHVFAVRTNTNRYSVSLLDTGRVSPQRNAFYSTDNNVDGEGQNAIEAAIHETQNLVDGSIVKIRLLNDIAINDETIAKGNFVFGKASLQGERLHIEITSLRKGNSLFPVKLLAYDLDGMEGVHIPGAITREVAKQSAGNSLQTFEMGSLDPSLKAQATTAGINAAKTLLTKKAKLIKVTVKAGYKILLREESQY